MAEASELQAIHTISSEVDDAQYQVILTTECIKAQAFLVEKLKKQAHRRKEKCEYISSANMKLQSEITQAEQEIKSFLKTKDTIRMVNVELKKELLIAREKSLDVIERLKTGEQKYENMWLECKNRYESLPYVQKLQETTEKEKTLKDQITALFHQAELLAKEIEAKKEACLKIDRERIIQLAEFMVNDRPKLIQRANEKFKALKELSNELKNLKIETMAEEKAAKKEKAAAVEETATTSVDQNRNVDESTLIMPKLQLDSLDLDDLISVKLDEVKMKKVDYTAGLERTESFSKSYFDIGTTIFNRKTHVDESISSYFSKPSDKNKNDYSKNKLINILGDVKIDANDAIDMISKVNPDALLPVDSISAEDKPQPHVDTCVVNKAKEPIQHEETDDSNMTSSNTEIVVKPPTQFLDASLRTQQSQKSQEVKKTVSFELPSTSQSDIEIGNKNEDSIVKKTVSFDLASTSQSDIEIGNKNEDSIVMEQEANITINSQLDLGDADERFMKIKDMVLKKHNLDLSPPFVYGKNINLQKKTENNVVTSKFFKSNDMLADELTDNVKETRSEIQAEENKIKNEVPKTIQQENAFSAMMMNSRVIELDVEQDMVSSPKKPKIDDIFKADKPFGGYLFRHGPQGLPESLDLSMNTTEDGDIDFAHGIDSSLLLSPKADIPMGNENIEVRSQDAPNFLLGLRKAGLSLFGRLPAGDSNADSSASNQGNGGFNFNFSGEDKKNRGGLFSLFQ